MKLYEVQVRNFWIKTNIFQTENYYNNPKEAKLSRDDFVNNQDCNKKDVRIIIWERTGELLK